MSTIPLRVLIWGISILALLGNGVVLLVLLGTEQEERQTKAEFIDHIGLFGGCIYYYIYCFMHSTYTATKSYTRLSQPLKLNILRVE